MYHVIWSKIPDGKILRVSQGFNTKTTAIEKAIESLDEPKSSVRSTIRLVLNDFEFFVDGTTRISIVKELAL